jgi:hypothetical protein
LFEKKFDSLLATLAKNIDDPITVHRPRSIAALAANDYPMDTRRSCAKTVICQRLGTRLTNY